MKPLFLTLVLFVSLPAVAETVTTPSCRVLNTEQVDKIFEAIRMSPVLVTCSNYAAILEDTEKTPVCEPGSYNLGPSAEPEVLEDPVDGGKILVWFATDAPDLNYVWVQTNAGEFTSLGSLIGCVGSDGPDAVLHLAPGPVAVPAPAGS